MTSSVAIVDQSENVVVGWVYFGQKTAVTVLEVRSKTVLFFY